MMERIDDLQLKGLKIIQDPQMFCFGTDAVLLADFTKIPKGSRVLDLGTGTGILPLLMYGRQTDAHYTGLEIQKPLCDLAQRSAQLNKLEQSVSMVCGDIKKADQMFKAASFNVIVSNPPYEKADDGKARDNASHMIARKEIKIDFDTLCSQAGKLLQTGGSFFLIHRSIRLAELLCTLKKYQMEPKEMRVVQAQIDSDPKYVLIRAVKDAREHIRVHAPLVLYEPSGEQSKEYRRIYGDLSKSSKGE